MAMVVLFHGFPEVFSGGFVGVDVFFVISGYLITRLILDELRGQSFSLTIFFHRRIIRIFPALLVVVAISLVFGYLVMTEDELFLLTSHASASVFFVQNYLIMSSGGYFDFASTLKPLLHVWSLSIEEQFYVFWPFLIILLWRTSASFLKAFILLAAISFGYNLLLAEAQPNEAYLSPLARAWILIFGGLVAYCQAEASNTLQFIVGNIDSNRHKLLIELITVGALATLLFSLFQIDDTVPYPHLYAMAPALSAVALIVVGNHSQIARLLLSNRFVVEVGLISYPLYLWHWPVLSFLYIIEGDTPHSDARLIAIVLSLILASSTYRLVEKPIQALGRRRLQVSASLFVILLTTGLLALTIRGGVFAGEDSQAREIHFRKGLEHKIGESFAWFPGRDGWLFLGNAWGKQVEKLKLGGPPEPDTIKAVLKPLSEMVQATSDSGIDTLLVIGPNKATVYPEFLPAELIPSKNRYLSSFLSELSAVDGLEVYDPTSDLRIEKKNSGQLLYPRTDSHWNSLGAYKTYLGIMRRLGLPAHHFEFKQGPILSGDIISMTREQNFPLELGDNWLAIAIDEVFPEEYLAAGLLGEMIVTENPTPLIDESLWVVGDSFTNHLRPFLSATFREVNFIGHWGHDNISRLAEELKKQDVTPPDVIIVVRVERSF